MAPFRSFFRVIEFGNFVVRGLKQKKGSGVLFVGV